MVRLATLKLGAISLLTVALLSLPALAPVAGGSAAQAPFGQTIPRTQPPGPLPASRSTGAPALRLTWAASETHMGVPVDLTVQALAAGEQPDAARKGTVLLQVDDTAVTIAASGAASADSGVPRGRGQQVALPLVAGVATATLTFARPGRQTVLALLQDAPQIAGESTALVVRSTFFAIQAQPAAAQGTPALFTVVAQDDQHRPLTGYSGSLLVRSDDAEALVEPATAGGSGSASGGATGSGPAAAYRFPAGGNGTAQFRVSFGQPGTHTLSVHDARFGTRLATAPIAVSPAPAASEAVGKRQSAVVPAGNAAVGKRQSAVDPAGNAAVGSGPRSS